MISEFVNQYNAGKFAQDIYRKNKYVNELFKGKRGSQKKNLRNS